MDLADAARKIVAEGGYTFWWALREGISPGFLAIVLDENWESVVEVAVRWAKEAGELGCVRCGRYYTRNQARLEGDVPLCPACDKPLQSASCALCGKPLNSCANWQGHYLGGFCFCPECLPKATEEMKRAAGRESS